MLPAASPSLSDRTPPSDQALIAAIAEGDRGAFQLLYIRHAGRLLAAARRWTTDEQVAEDVLQDTFLAVWCKAAGFNAARGEVGGWLYTICRHKAHDVRRRAEPNESIDSADLSNQPMAGPLADSTDRLDLHRELHRLDRRQRDALRLAYFGGLTYAETAARLRIPLGTLKSRLRFGLRRLSERLSQ
ncbi:MAG: sigma-70 family RNA polymerase sigma factor [Acidobacteriota bacterium]